MVATFVQGPPVPFGTEIAAQLSEIEWQLLQLQSDRPNACIYSLVQATRSIATIARRRQLLTLDNLAERLTRFSIALYREKWQTDEALQWDLRLAYSQLSLPLLSYLCSGELGNRRTLTAVELAFGRLESRLADSLRNQETIGGNTPIMEGDISITILQVDVARVLENLARALARPEEADVAAELRTCAESLERFGQMLDIPTLESVAQTTLSALATSPNRATDIAILALDDFETTRMAALRGDRLSGGPSATLMAFCSPTN
jgi:chemotaxis family two-component system sensor histidine kinase/response regulator PixL